MLRRRLISKVVLLAFVAMLSLSPAADAQTTDKGKLIITQFYSLKNISSSSTPVEAFDVEKLVTHITENIDPKTWQLLDTPNFRRADGYIVWPESTIRVDYEHNCLAIRTTVRNHRAIKKYLSSVRDEHASTVTR